MNYPDKCLAGLHGTASGANTGADYEAGRVARIEAVKLMTTHPPEDVLRWRQLNAGMFFVVRLYIDLGNRRVGGLRAGEDWLPDVQRFWDRGVRHFEVHNEPNLRQEGMWTNWADGREFAAWWTDCAIVLRLRFAGIQLGFPGLSPGGDVPGVRYRSDWFLREARAALEAADWVGAHAYEVFDTTNRGAGGAWRDVRDAAPAGKPLAITEFSSPLQSPPMQARQYRAYYEALRREPGVFAAFCFCVYGDSFQHESWRTADGRLLPHAAEVARRQERPAPPQAAEPPGIMWLPEPHAVVYVDDKYGGAVIRDYAGREYKTVPPGTELARRSAPATIAGLPRRVVVNRDLGLHVLADRILEQAPAAPAPQAVFAWPTEYKTVTQAFGARPSVYATWGLAGHEGIDLRAPSGSQIFAAYAGTVKLVARGGNYGVQVRIAHDIGGRQVETVYAHLERALVAEGDEVQAGQPIGVADSTGNVTGPHLHFGVRVVGEAPAGFAGYSDPAPWLGLA